MSTSGALTILKDFSVHNFRSKLQEDITPAAAACTLCGTYHSTPCLQAEVHAGKAYVPLLRRAWKLFHELQDDMNIPCIHQTGCLDVGSGVVHAAKKACDAHGVEYSLMPGAEVSQQFPGYEFGREEVRPQSCPWPWPGFALRSVSSSCHG